MRALLASALIITLLASDCLADGPLRRHPTLFGMLVRNNNIRRRVGLRPHRINESLTKAAQDHANYMARTGQFSHYTNGGPTGRAQKHGFNGGVLENIATGGGIDNAFVMWTNSGAHYASMVSNTTDAGFGYAIGPNGQTYFVGVYGTAKATSDSETEEEVKAAIEEKKAAEEAQTAEVSKVDKDAQ